LLFFGACQSTNGGGYVTEGMSQESSGGFEDDSIMVARGDISAAKQPVTDDAVAYEAKLRALANGDTTGRWPVTNQPQPLPGAMLPHKRIVAFYGNLYSVKMGILGELPPDEMLPKLDE